MHRFSLRQLEYFVACVDHGSTADAASALNVSQPTISIAVTKLEDQLGVHRPHARVDQSDHCALVAQSSSSLRNSRTASTTVGASDPAVVAANASLSLRNPRVRPRPRPRPGLLAAFAFGGGDANGLAFGF